MMGKLDRAHEGSEFAIFKFHLGRAAVITMIVASPARAARRHRVSAAESTQRPAPVTAIATVPKPPYGIWPAEARPAWPRPGRGRSGCCRGPCHVGAAAGMMRPGPEPLPGPGPASRSSSRSRPLKSPSDSGPVTVVGCPGPATWPLPPRRDPDISLPLTLGPTCLEFSRACARSLR